MPVFIGAWVVIIGFVLVWYVVAKLKQKKQVEHAEIENKDLPQLKITSISLGYFGEFNASKIGIKYLQEDCVKSENKAENEQLLSTKFAELKTLIESHSQFIINYFMSMPLDLGEFDEMWDEWLFDEKQKGLSEEELNKLRKDLGKKVLAEMPTYLEKETEKDIAELYKKYLPYFDYNKFVKTIELEYLNLEIDGFSVQLSDKNMELFCAAYESFDLNLNGYDWHNF